MDLKLKINITKVTGASVMKVSLVLTYHETFSNIGLNYGDN